MEKEIQSKLAEGFVRLKGLRSLMPAIPGMSHAEIFMLHNIGICTKHREDTGRPAGLRVSELSKFCGMSRPAVSQQLNVLEKRGLVLRTMDKDDRRVVFVELTEEGNEKLKSSFSLFFRNIKLVEEEFGEENIDQLVDLLNRLSEVVEHVRNEGRTKNQDFLPDGPGVSMNLESDETL